MAPCWRMAADIGAGATARSGIATAVGEIADDMGSRTETRDFHHAKHTEVIDAEQGPGCSGGAGYELCSQ